MTPAGLLRAGARVALLAAAAAAGGCAGLAALEPVPETAVSVPVRRVDMSVVIPARGELEAVEASPVAVPMVQTGALQVKDLAPEGGLVAAGDVIVVFDESQLNIQLSNHRASFRSSERQIERTQIQWGIEKSGILKDRQVAGLEKAYAEEFQLEDEAIYSQLEILEAMLDRDYAEEKIVFADAKLELKGEYYDIDESILDVEREQSGSKIERVRESLASLVLEAPIPGMVVYRKNWRGSVLSVGDSLWPGNVIMSIVNPSATALRVHILERDATGIEVGDPAEVTIDARPDRIFPGTVASLSKLSRPIESESPVKYFEALITIEDGDPEILKPGMKGEARIRTSEVAGALVVPRPAVRGTDETYHVLVQGPRGPERRDVKVGPGDLVRVVVTEGLREGDRVLLGGGPGEMASPAAGTTPAQAAP